MLELREIAGRSRQMATCSLRLKSTGRGLPDYAHREDGEELLGGRLGRGVGHGVILSTSARLVARDASWVMVMQASAVWSSASERVRPPVYAACSGWSVPRLDWTSGGRLISW
jgi:hypothetical protein